LIESVKRMNAGKKEKKGFCKWGNQLTDLRDTQVCSLRTAQCRRAVSGGALLNHSKETFEMIITAAEKLAVNEFAPVNSAGDKIGCQWQDGKVPVPEPFRRLLKSSVKADG